MTRDAISANQTAISANQTAISADQTAISANQTAWPLGALTVDETGHTNASEAPSWAELLARSAPYSGVAHLDVGLAAPFSASAAAAPYATICAACAVVRGAGLACPLVLLWLAKRRSARGSRPTVEPIVAVGQS